MYIMDEVQTLSAFLIHRVQKILYQFFEMRILRAVLSRDAELKFKKICEFCTEFGIEK